MPDMDEGRVLYGEEKQSPQEFPAFELADHATDCIAHRRHAQTLSSRLRAVYDAGPASTEDQRG